MKNLLTIFLVVLAVFAANTLAVTRPDVIGLYDAGPEGGGPVDLDPVLQGWKAHAHNILGTTVFAIQPDPNDAYNAWQIHDESSSHMPRYEIDLTDADYQATMAGFLKLVFAPLRAGIFLHGTFLLQATFGEAAVSVRAFL